jgi:hypothetical protein
VSLRRTQTLVEDANLRIWRVVRRETATYTMLILADTEESAREAKDAQLAASSVAHTVDILSVTELVSETEG